MLRIGREAFPKHMLFLKFNPTPRIFSDPAPTLCELKPVEILIVVITIETVPLRMPL